MRKTIIAQLHLPTYCAYLLVPLVNTTYLLVVVVPTYPLLVPVYLPSTFLPPYTVLNYSVPAVHIRRDSQVLPLLKVTLLKELVNYSLGPHLGFGRKRTREGSRTSRRRTRRRNRRRNRRRTNRTTTNRTTTNKEERHTKRGGKRHAHHPLKLCWNPIPECFG